MAVFKMTLTIQVVLLATFSVLAAEDLSFKAGHLKPFGFGQTTPIEEVNNFPKPMEFFENYVWPLKPLKMKGAAKISKAFSKWTDDYFLSLRSLDKEKVTVETRKKESRQQEVLSMSFTDFIKTYNNTENYMVESVPSPVRNEVVIPCPLQCSDIVENNLVDDVMWFSSGGTKSVVHTDAVDNINCLYRGEKELFFVDPSVYGDKVDLDHPEGAYSSMDVDSVDFTKYPGMADVEYLHVNLSAGDCLYIPYRWIHQVRSYGSNLAVNIWWKHYMTGDVDFERCNDPCDLDFTLAEAEFGGFGQIEMTPEDIRSHFQSFLGVKKKSTLLEFLKPLLGSEHKRLLQSSQKMNILMLGREMFQLLDTDGDGHVTKEEVDNAEISNLQEIAEKMMSLEKLVDRMYDEINIDVDDEDITVGDDKDEIDPDIYIGKDEL